MKQKKNLIIIATIIFVGLLAGTAVYWQQNSVLTNVENELQRRIDNLETKFSELENRNSQLEKTIVQLRERNLELTEENSQLFQDRADLQKEIEELTREPEIYVRLLSPNGGENLCLGDNFRIEWEHKGLTSVRILSYLPGEGMGYLAVLPADHNETGQKGRGVYNWEVGSMFYGGTLEPGTIYKLIIEDASLEGSDAKDESDGVFSIVNCKG